MGRLASEVQIALDPPAHALMGLLCTTSGVPWHVVLVTNTFKVAAEPGVQVNCTDPDAPPHGP